MYDYFVNDMGFYAALLATAREMVANADSLARNNKRDMVLLGVLGYSEFALARVLREGDEDGWKEAVRSGRINIEMAEIAAEGNVKDRGSPVVAGKARSFLADGLDEYHYAEDARKERWHALKDYQLALRRYPADTNKIDQTDREDKRDIITAISVLEAKIGKEVRP